MERQKLVQDENGHWVMRYVNCGKGIVGMGGRPVSEYGRRASGGAWQALGANDDPTAAIVERKLEREEILREQQWIEFANMAAV